MSNPVVILWRVCPEEVVVVTIFDASCAKEDKKVVVKEDTWE